MRKAKCEPKDGFTPIPLEFLDTKRKTIMEIHKGKSVVKEDDWRSGELPTTKSTESWKGRTIFRVLAGGIESRTLVPATVCDPARGKKRSPEDIIIAKVSLKTSQREQEQPEAQREQEQPEAFHRERYRLEGEFAPREAFHGERSPR